jgi:hypothetical protein
VLRKATPQAPATFFGQFRKECSENFAPEVATWPMCLSPRTCYRGSIVKLGRADESHPFAQGGSDRVR